jgi:hypothetical protein
MSKHIKRHKRNKAILALGAVPVLMVSAFASTAFSSWTGHSLSSNAPSFSLLSSITPISGLGAAVDSAGTGINLTWTPSTQKTDGSNVVNGYVIQGATNSTGPWTTLTSAGSGGGSALTQTASLVTDVVPSSEPYTYYRVAAMDNNWISSWSSPVAAPVLTPTSPTTTATVPDITTGSTPATVTVPSGYSFIDVTLNASAGGSGSYFYGSGSIYYYCSGGELSEGGNYLNHPGVDGNTVTAMIPVTPGETLSFITGINGVDYGDVGGGFSAVFAGSTPSASNVLALAGGGNGGYQLSDPYYLTTASSPISLYGASGYGSTALFVDGTPTYYTCTSNSSTEVEEYVPETTGYAYGSYGGVYSSTNPNYVSPNALSSYTSVNDYVNSGVGSITYAFYK